ncbi:MAG: DUF3134 domain-containing protein [Spirulinaceae cyanobacterium]
MHNPSLTQETRYEPAKVIPLKQEVSLLDWLEANGRLIARDDNAGKVLPDSDEEISDLMENDDAEFEDDSDDDDEDLED